MDHPEKKTLQQREMFFTIVSDKKKEIIGYHKTEISCCKSERTFETKRYEANEGNSQTRIVCEVRKQGISNKKFNVHNSSGDRSFN